MSVHFFKELGLTLTCEQSVDDLSEAWKSDPYWVNRATKLDDSDLVYFLPKVYQTLASLTDKTFNYIPVHYGDMCLYLFGTYPGEQPFGGEDLCDKTVFLTKPRWLTLLWCNVDRKWS